MNNTMEKPSVLILGGCGFIGRNLVEYLVSNELVRYVRVVDKVPPQIAWLSPKHELCFDNGLVEFKSANLINSESCKAAFVPPSEIKAWDFAINCACETKSAQTDPVYKEGIFVLSLNCASEACLRKVKRYVEISSGQIGNSEKVPHKEGDATAPWSFISRWKNKVENGLQSIPGLKYTIIRPATIYGLGDKTGLMPRIMVAAVYKQLGETMKLLWNEDLKINTVHVLDVCRAIWFLCNREDTIGQIYNVVDNAGSTQGTISNLLSDLFKIKVDYYGNLVSTAADIPAATEEANDKHLRPWAEACRSSGIQNTPLSPHMDSELLLHKSVHLDGTKLKDLGFEIAVAKPTLKNLAEIVQDYVDMKVFPKQLLE